MQITIHGNLNSTDTISLFNIWNAVYPTEATFQKIEDIIHYLNQKIHPTHYVARDLNDKIDGWLMTFTRDQSRFFVLLVNKQAQAKGIGTRLMSSAMKDEETLNGWVVTRSGYHLLDGTPYLSPINFYKKLGFQETTTTITHNELETTLVQWEKNWNTIPIT